MNTPAKNILDVMARHGIGFDPRFFERIADTPNFPPHNIVQYSDDHFELTLAVAGYSEAEIDITMHHDILTVNGTKIEKSSRPEGYQLLYSGIAFRDFSRQFKVGDHVYVDNATLKDGLLIIDLVRRVPESMKPKKIAIGQTARLSA